MACVNIDRCLAFVFENDRISSKCYIFTEKRDLNNIENSSNHSTLYLVHRKCRNFKSAKECTGYLCDDGSCVQIKPSCKTNWCNSSLVECDGFRDCPDGSDEIYCNWSHNNATGLNPLRNKCPLGHFTCENGRCISYSLLCSPAGKCGDNSEMNYCDTSCNQDTHFLCNDTGKCIEIHQQCDGVEDCTDFSDELNCVCNASTQFSCNNTGRCIPKSWRCDGTNDCGDDSDEFNCSRQICNITRQHQCTSSGRCIPVEWRCDGYADCGDFSDEMTCECSLTQFRCDNGQCVPSTFRCNQGMCIDGSDMIGCVNCNTSSFQCDLFQCKPLSSWCDGISDCTDGSDENNCIKSSCPLGFVSCNNTAERNCIHHSLLCNGLADCSNATDEKNCECSRETMFRCASGICINDTVWCDGKVDCEDGSDEPADCENKCNPHNSTGCKNGRCVSITDVCDGINNCGDYSDEIQCSDCFEKLHTFTCDMGLCLDATAFCNGTNECPDGSDEKLDCHTKCAPTLFSCDNGRCIDKLNVCNGFNDCGDYTDEITCSCRASEIKCDMGMCVSTSLWCNTYRDCPDGSDEKSGCSKVCPQNALKCNLTDSCIASFKICDKLKDCPDGSDEFNCECKSDIEYACHDGPCITTQWICDGVRDCPMGDDEEDTRCSSCTSVQYTCLTNYQCIEASERCDGIYHCNDTSDEGNCLSTFNNSEVDAVDYLIAEYYGTTDNYVCVNKWNKIASDLACIQMGKGIVQEWMGVKRPENVTVIVLNETITVNSTSFVFINTTRCLGNQVLALKCKDPDCGKAPVTQNGFRSYLANGSLYPDSLWPWHVSIYYGEEFICSGWIFRSMDCNCS